ncbi:LamG-like jellyroll fold domain-containing protein [Nostoc sp.]|uniref:LamG-like jellyroll fold domain-containing protein n=1 Tax=Nostoc sp. TaxID=1180 RepID=UPI002FF97624
MNWNEFTVENVLNPNQWNHVAASFNGNEYRLYANGNLVYTTTQFKGLKPYQTQQLTIGKGDGQFDKNFQGQIDEVRVWNVARTYEEIQQNLIEPLKGNEKGLVGYWQFNNNALDSSINKNNGTLQNSTGNDYIYNPLPQIGYVEVNLDKPVDNPIGLWLRYNLSGNATQGTDYFGSQVRRSIGEQPFNAIIIPDKEEAGKIYFTALPDAIKEGDEQIQITLIPYNFDGQNADNSKGVVGVPNNSNYRVYNTNQSATIVIKDNSAYLPSIVIKDQFNRVVNQNNPLSRKSVIAVDDLFPGTVTTSDSKSPKGEEKEKAFDNQSTTKWLTFNNQGWLQYQLNNGQAQVVNQYAITSANDFSERDPQDWRFLGSNDGINFVELHKVTAEIFASRLSTKGYNFNNTTAYKYYRLDVTKNAGGKELQIAELQLNNFTDLPGKITSKSTFIPSPIEEQQEKAFDNQSNTKWLSFDNQGWLQYQLNNGKAQVVNQYAITSANDSSQRDPQDWRLLGSNDGINFVELHKVTAETFASRFLTKTYKFDNTKAYNIYRLEVTKNAGAKELQIADLQLNGINSAGSIFTYNVQLSTQPTAPVTVNFATSTGQLSQKQITIQPSDWDKPQALYLTGVAVDGKVTATFTSSDANYNNQTREIPFSNTLQPPLFQVTEGDPRDKEIIPLMRITPIDKTVSEGIAQNGQFLVELSDPAPENGLNIYYNISGSAERSQDYQLLGNDIGKIQIAPGEKKGVISFNVIDDNLDEQKESITINLSQRNGYILDNTYKSTNIDIEDNDKARIKIVNINTLIEENGVSQEVIATSLSPLTTSESGNNATFAVRLDSQPLDDVTITFDGINVAESKFSTPSLQFTKDNWNQYQKVTVTGVDDQVIDGDFSYKFAVKTTSKDPSYESTDISLIEIENCDNDSNFISVQELNDPNLTKEKRQQEIKDSVQKLELQTEADIKKDLGQEINLDFTTVNNTSLQASFSISNSVLKEDGNPLKLTVNLDRAAPEDIIVKYGVVSGSATENVDYKITGGSFALLRQIGNTNPLNGFNVGKNAGIAFGDLNNDGLLDALAIGGNGTINYYQNTGTENSPLFIQKDGTANPFNAVTVPDGAIAIADLNKDGLADVVIGTTGGVLRYYRNTGSNKQPQFTEQIDNNNLFNGINLGNNSTPILVDFDLNGLTDLVVTAGNGSTKYYKATLEGNVTKYIEQIDIANPFNNLNGQLGFADLDKDGDLDVTVGSTDGTLKYYQNNNGVLSPTANNDLAGFGVGSTVDQKELTLGLQTLDSQSTNPNLAIIKGTELNFGGGVVATIADNATLQDTTGQVKGQVAGQVKVLIDPQKANAINQGSQTKLTDETVQIRLLPGEGYQLGGEKTEAILGIVDDDQPGVRIIEFGDHTTVVEGKTATFQISLLSEPTKNVTITITDPNGQTRVLNDLLTFTPQNWYKLQTVTVSGVDEGVIEAGDFHTSFLKYKVDSEDATYKNFAVTDQQINIIDRLIDKAEAIAGVKEGLRSSSEILKNLELPIIGSADGKVPSITEGLDDEVAKAIDGTDNLTTSKLEKILEDTLHNFKISLKKFGIDSEIKPFAGVDVKVEMTEDDIKVQFEASNTYNLFDFALDADLGLPALGLKTQGNISASFKYDFGLGFGFHNDFGFYIDTEKTKFDAAFNVSLGEGVYGTDKDGYYFESNVDKNNPDAKPKRYYNKLQSSGNFTFLKDDKDGTVYWDKNNNGTIEKTIDTDISKDPILQLDRNGNKKLDSNLEGKANLSLMQLDFANDPKNHSQLDISFKASLSDDLTKKINFLDINGNGNLDFTDTNGNGAWDKGEPYTEPTGNVKTVADPKNPKTTVKELIFNPQDPVHKALDKNNNNQFDANEITVNGQKAQVLTFEEQPVQVFLDVNGNGKADASEPIGTGFKDASGSFILKYDSKNPKHQVADKNKNGAFDVKPVANDPGQGEYRKEGLIRYFDFNLNNQLDAYEPFTNASDLLQDSAQFVLVKKVKDANTTYYYFDSNSNGVDNADYRLIQQTAGALTWYFDLNHDGIGQNFEKLQQPIVDKIYDSTTKTLKNAGVLKPYTTKLEGTFVKVDDGQRLTVKEITKLLTDSTIKFKDLINYNLGGEANLGLQMKASVGGDGAFPSIGTNLAVNYPIFNFGNQEEAKEQKFTLAFNDLTLDLGTFITKFAKPVFNALNDLFKPLRPVIDVLNTDTGFLIKILPEYDKLNKAKGYTGNNDGKLSLIEFFTGAANDPDLKSLIEPLLKQANLTYEQFQKSISSAKKLVDLFTKVDEVVKKIAAFENGENITINLGSYDFKNIKGASKAPTDSTTQSQLPADLNPNSPVTDTKEQVKNTKGGSLLDSLNSVPGLNLDLLKPITILRILMGEKDVNLLTFDVPDIDLIVPFTTGERVLGYVPPGLEVTGKFDANFGLKTDLFVGFDTSGLQKWGESDFSLADTYKIFDGFYLRDGIDINNDGILQPDEDSNELSLSAKAQLSLSANAYIAKLTGYGGLEGTAGLDIVDAGERNGTNDGKIHFSEVGEKLSKAFSGEYGNNIGRILTEFIDLTGKLDAFFGIEVKVGISVLGLEIMKTVYKDELGRYPIFKFDLKDLFPDTVSEGSQAAIAPPKATEDDDTFNGSSSNDTFNGAGGNDILKGEKGDDDLKGGNGNDTLYGGMGNDQLEGNAGNDILTGEDGDDKLDGGVDDDTLDGGAGKDKLNGGNGNDILTGGDGGEELNGGDGNDTLTGASGNDVLIGGNGNDILTGGAVDDILTGGAGADIFKLLSPQDNGYDRITDFNILEDKIHISKVGFGGITDTNLFTYSNGILSYNNINLTSIENDNKLIPNFSINSSIVLV